MSNSYVTATYVLTDVEKANIKNIIQSKVLPYRPETYDAFMSSCRLAADKLPSSISKWRDQVREMDFGLIRNLPVDTPLPVTPTSRHGADHISMLADGLIGTISALFGTLYSIEGKIMNRHIHNIYPVEGDEYTQLGTSKIELEWHVEEAYHSARPHWIGLFCLRSDTEAETKIARARDFQLPKDLIRTLNEHQFKLRLDESFGDETPSTYISTYILTGSMSDPQIVFDPAYTVCENEDENTVLDAISSAANKVQREITLLEGDLLVFDNRRVIHARSAYHPRMDGTDRWLKRALILEDSEWTSKLNKGIMPFNIS